MSPIIRTGLIAALVVGVSLCAFAAVDPARIEQSKLDVVRAGLAQQGRIDAASARLAAVGSASALSEVRLNVSVADPEVRVTTNGKPEYKAFTIKEENKIVLDVANTVNLVSGTTPSENEAIVKRVRTSMFALEPEFVSRVVVDLDAPCPFEVRQDDQAITLVLHPSSAPTAHEAAASSDPASAIDEKVANVCASLESVKAEEPKAAEQTESPSDAKQIAERVRAFAAQAGSAVSSFCGTSLTVVGRGAAIAANQESERARAQRTTLLTQLEAVESSHAPQSDPRALQIAARVEKLAEELEQVQATQFDAASAPVPSLAAVTEANDSQAPAEAAPPPTPEPAHDAAAPEPAPAAQPATPETQPAPPALEAPPAAAPVAENAPPEKRAEQPETGAAVVTRMKELLSGISAAAKGVGAEAVKSPTQVEAAAVAADAKAPASAKNEVVVGDPMNQIVNIDFRDMDLTNVVALLAQKAQINVIAGANLTGAVTASLKNVTLRQAIDTVLRMNNLGIIEEEGIFRIVPYQEAMAAKRRTIMVKLDNAKATDVQKTLDEVLKGSPDDTLMSLSANESTNMLIVAGPESRVMEFEKLAKELDIAKPVTPTVTQAIKVNNAEPAELNELIKSMLSKDIGKVAIDTRSRHIVVTDAPVVIEQVRELINQIDMPVKQVSVDSMIVDAALTDASETGVDWIMKAVHNYNLNGKQVGSLVGPVSGVDSTGDTIQRDVISDMSRAGTGFLSLGLLTDNINIKAAISAQIDNRNAKLLANPVVVTVENQKATINITEEIPYQESKQSVTGPPMTSTNFKDIGIILEVTPKVSHDDHVIAKVMAKQSRQNGVFNNIPIEAKRTTDTTLRMKNGQTIFIGGLRRFDDATQAKKVPVLGDIPVMNFLFRNNVINKQSSELLVFLTCNVLPDEIGPLDAELQKAHDSLESTPKVPDTTKDLGRIFMHPKPAEDPNWRWRRAQ